jgi:hypothetical protein
MRILAGILTTLLTSVVVAAGSAPAAAPRLALVTCDDAGGSVAQPGRPLYGSRLGLSWGAKASKLSPFPNVRFPYSSRLPLFIRAGGRAFTIEIAATWHRPAGMAWDRRGDAKPKIARGVRVVPCPGGDKLSVWLAYPGGFYVARPACVPLVITIGTMRYRARVPLGRACP